MERFPKITNKYKYFFMIYGYFKVIFTPKLNVRADG